MSNRWRIYIMTRRLNICEKFAASQAPSIVYGLAISVRNPNKFNSNKSNFEAAVWPNATRMQHTYNLVVFTCVINLAAEIHTHTHKQIESKWKRKHMSKLTFRWKDLLLVARAMAVWQPCDIFGVAAVFVGSCVSARELEYYICVQNT